MGRMNSFQASIACLILKAFAGMMSALPSKAALFVGRRLGELSYFFIAKNRRKVYANLKIAFGKTKTPSEIREIARNFYHSFGQDVVELSRLPLIAKQGYEKYVDVEGRESVDQAMKGGKGLILLSVHSGNWELSNLVGSMIGYPYNMVANYLAHVNRVADYLDSLRQSAGCKIINPGIGGREIIRRLKKNEIVTLVADQGGEDGVLTEFFGRDASMSTGAVRIALKYGVPICMVNIYRLPGGRHKLLAKSFELVKTADFEMDVKVNIQHLANQFETWIKEHPHEYVWPYSTWKHSRRRRVLILDDGRTGHLRQSEAVAAQLATVYGKMGFAIDVEVVSVDFISSLHIWLLGLITGGKVLFHVFGLDLLKNFLAHGFYEKVFSIKPDIVISCGAKTAALCYWLAHENRARSIAVLRPGMVPYQNFDLVIHPEHDRRSLILPPNVCLTKAAPNLIDEEYLEQNKRSLLSRFSHLKMNLRPKLGLLIGGDTKGVRMTEQQIKVVIHQLKGVAENYNMDFLITTSRRTPEAVEQLILREFREYKRAALLVIANKINIPEAVGGVLSLADVVIVSGESISMVSEAASSGKRVVVFPVDGEALRPNENKYTRFVEELSRQGYLVHADTKDVGRAVDTVLRNKISTKPIQDHELIHKALEKLINR
jgi:Kdo2-lipid IVA lauroyltransferase/acyltransferase